MTAANIGGVLCVVQTPFQADGKIDADVFADEVDWLYQQGAAGVVIGMVSEILRLSSDERDWLARLLCDSASGRGSTVVSVSAGSTYEAVRHAERAVECGATAVMAAPPTTVAAGDDELAQYFTTIAASAGCPLVVQDASGYVGPPLSLELQARLQDELGEQVLFKPEAPPFGPKVTAGEL